MHEADWTFTAESADHVDAAELTLHGVRIAFVLIDAALSSLVHLITGRTRATIAARHVLTGSQRSARTRQLHALVYIWHYRPHTDIKLS